MAAQESLLKTHVDQGVLVLTVTCRQLEGEERARIFKEQLLGTVTQSGASRVILDLQHTLYVSSVTFWPLLALRKHLQEQGGRMILCGLVGGVHDVFTTTHMVSADGSTNAPFEMAPDCATALARLLEPAPEAARDVPASSSPAEQNGLH
jgi:anti-anti-sigma regulatory factor